MKTALFAVGIVVLIIATFLAVMWLWAWVVPDVFSGMVKAELLPAQLSFVQAVKLVVLLGILGISGRSSKS